ncbi:PREDICTED: vacuolar cation/proton exchanger 4 isoform X2 [Tarenaya hassleriana]|uniref:vacuolar cation/proton exchanger 4 isoform X2 n=1 Tax=Tarenaya hassleriana TaxID=28532 RepID=UPI00053C818D|nr:PREDICTED: vacuolar cation/proton exchanger 4 isoform X2 [Tarenaya hassleriana]
MASISTESPANLNLLENGGGCCNCGGDGVGRRRKDTAAISRHGRSAHNLSSSSLRKRSDLKLISRVPCASVRRFLGNLQEVLLGTRLCLLFPAVPLAVLARQYGFPRAWIFALSLLGLTPLAERISFLTEQIAFRTGPTVGGLLNATCGNATELIIAILAVGQSKIQLVKFSLLGSILSNLLLVLGTSLLCGGLANLHKEQHFDRREAGMNSLLLYLSLLCHTLPMLLRFSEGSDAIGRLNKDTPLLLSRVSSLLMLFTYFAYLIFHLCSHRQNSVSPEEEEEEEEEDVYDDNVRDMEEAVIGFWSALGWLLGMTFIVALLSQYVVGTIEDAANSWGLSVAFIGIILLPIVGNAAEHAGAVIFAFRNKLDITLGVALGSATQIALFVVPVSVVIGWGMGIEMDLNFDLVETACLALSIVATSLTLQEGSSHYMKGAVLLSCYVVISSCFFLSPSPPTQTITTGQTFTVPIFRYSQ